MAELTDHFATAAMLAQQAADINNDLARNPRSDHENSARNRGMKILIELAQVHATLAVAVEIRRGNSGWAQP
jgi:hypothetical protein